MPERDEVGPFTLGVTYTDPLTMAGAYATFAARGVYCEPRPVTQILDSSGKVHRRLPGQVQAGMPQRRGRRGERHPAWRGGARWLRRGTQPRPAARPARPAPSTTTRPSGSTATPRTWRPSRCSPARTGLGHGITLNGQTVGGAYISEAFGSTQAGPIWGDAMKAIAQYLPDSELHRAERHRRSPAGVVTVTIGLRHAACRPRPASCARRGSCRPSARWSTRRTAAARWPTSASAPARRSAPAARSRSTSPTARPPPPPARPEEEGQAASKGGGGRRWRLADD